LPIGAFASQIQVTSDAVEIQHRNGGVALRFSKNANVAGDGFQLSADCIEILVNGAGIRGEAQQLSAISEIHATDGASFWQKSCNGKGDRIDIYPPRKILTLEGNAEITDVNNGTVRGEVLTIDSANRRIRANGMQSKRPSMSIDCDPVVKLKNLKRSANDSGGKK
jgi:lipopolysaccharide export system protein LptA